jgi:c-di-GMP-binding flagellar brake protein YcgR
MPELDRRTYPRIHISNGVSYACLNDKFKEVDQGIGKVLNISQGGVLLETPKKINSRYILIMSIDLEDNMIEIRGKVIYSKKHPANWMLTGVKFMEPYSMQRKAIAEFIRAYHYRKKTNEAH